MKLIKSAIRKGQLNLIVSSQKKKKRFKSANQLIATIKSWDSVDIIGLSDAMLVDHASVLISHLNWAIGEWGWRKRKTYVTLHRILTAATPQLNSIWTEVMKTRPHLDNQFALADSIERLEWAFKYQKDRLEAQRLVLIPNQSTTSLQATYTTATTV